MVAHKTSSQNSIQSPFGMVMPGRNWTAASSDGYGFGFNGKLKDDEIKGNSNSYDFGARIYDSRLGVWLSLDLLFKQHPDFSSYCFGLNNPIFLRDIDGKDVDDSKFRKRGNDYHKGYKIFAKTSQGRKFISEFSNGHDTNVFGTGPNQPGSFSSNTLKFSNNAWGSGGTKVTLNNGKNEFDLSKVTADDIKEIGIENLTFTFNKQLSPYIVKSESENSNGEAAQVLGHEAFLHAEYYLNEIVKLQKEIDAGSITEEQVASRLQKIEAAGGSLGNVDHENWILGKKPNYDKYIEEVLQDSEVSQGEKESVKKNYNDEINQYSGSSGKTPKIKKK